MKVKEFQGKYRFLSNFFAELDGSCVEKEYQSAKAKHPQDKSFILASPSAGEAKRQGRRVELVANWDNIKRDVMYDLVRAKFQQQPLRNMLLDTGDAMLEEGNYWGDTYWGIYKGQGQNWLGKILMRVRSELEGGKLCTT